MRVFLLEIFSIGYVAVRFNVVPLEVHRCDALFRAEAARVAATAVAADRRGVGVGDYLIKIRPELFNFRPLPDHRPLKVTLFSILHVTPA